MAAPLAGAIAPAAPLQGKAHSVSPAQKARAVAEDFETVFLGHVFKEMFSNLDGSGPLGSAGGGVWRSFLTDEYARSFAKAGGIGLSDQVYRSLLAQQEARAR